MAQTLYRAIIFLQNADGTAIKCVKYRNCCLNRRFWDFLDSDWPAWRYVNLYFQDNKQFDKRVYNRNHPADRSNRVGGA